MEIRVQNYTFSDPNLTKAAAKSATVASGRKSLYSSVHAYV